ncbi:MAG: C39 family peptidase [Collinsella sp.]|nr:C39 family peptidase [Collinsella sp.]
MRGRRPRRGIRAAALVVAMLTIGAIALSSWRNGGPTAPVAAGWDALTAPRSTPKREWSRGAIPHLYQIDPAWATEPYAGGTIGENGCGPTCLAMVYVALTGRTNRGPVEMARLSEDAGFTVDGMTSWELMTVGAAQLGMVGEEMPADAGRVSEALAAGVPIIASVRPGDFTTTGHFIVLAGIDESGRLVVRDPNSRNRSEKTWDIERVLLQCSNLWSFRLA